MSRERDYHYWFCAVYMRMVAQTGATEISGTVRAVNAQTVTVATAGDHLPNAGDKAEIFFRLAGEEGDLSVATGSVVKSGAIPLR